MIGLLAGHKLRVLSAWRIELLRLARHRPCQHRQETTSGGAVRSDAGNGRDVLGGGAAGRSEGHPWHDVERNELVGGRVAAIDAELDLVNPTAPVDLVLELVNWRDAALWIDIGGCADRTRDRTHAQNKRNIVDVRQNAESRHIPGRDELNVVPL